MSINLSMPELTELHPKITVFGVGGAGGNAVGNMIRASLAGVEFVVANTDAQALSLSPADRKIQLGVTTTLGLGAGSRPDVGRAAAEEAMDQIVEQLTGSHMVFITAGMGGGTGTGASPIIAKVARDQGILTVGVVTKPFQFEGNKRMRMAEEGIQQLQEFVDTLIVIPNQNLFRIATEKTTFADAFAMADDVLHSGVRGITDLMVMPGLINLDFADVRTVMSEMGKAMMGTGEAEGERRALEAAEAAITNPLLDDVSLAGARGLLINITGGMDLTLYEVDEAANRIRSEVDSDANIIVGSTFDESTNGKIRVSVVATGIDVDEGRQIHPAIQVTSLDRSINHEVLPQVLEERRKVLARIKESQANTPANVLERELDAPASGDDTHGAQESVPADRSTLLDGEREEERVAPAPTPENLVHNTPEEPPQVVLPQTAEDPFIAPKPMRVDRDPETGSLNVQDRARTDTATRSQTDAVDKREPSLFERVTGSVKARRVEKKEEAARDDGSAPNLFGKVERSGVQTSAAVDQSGDPFSLGTPDPADRIVPTRTLRDQLDIPAFLRRQAN